MTSFENEFGMTPSELSDLRFAACSIALEEKGTLVTRWSLHKAPRTMAYIANQLYLFQAIYSKTGYATKILIHLELNGRPDIPYEMAMDRLGSDPAAFADIATWLLYQAMRQTQRDFALEICATPSREEMLSGGLLGNLTASCNEWCRRGQSVLEKSKSTLAISRLDLQILGGEAKTGGDFGLVFEFERSGEIKYLPIVFQAKRFTGTKADISQNHQKRGYQNNILRAQKCMAAYIFYENGNDAIDCPVPPLVKSALKTKPVHIEPKTDVYSDSLDLATFVLSGLDGSAEFPTAEDPKSALNMILANAGHLLPIVAIGNRQGIDLRFQQAWAQLRAATSAYTQSQASDEDLLTDERPTSRP